MEIESKEIITRARTRLILRQPFFGVVASYLKPAELKGMPFPAGTDGERLYYNPEMIKDTPIDEVETIIAHEVLHCAFLHHLRRGNRERMRWSIAADLSINPILVDAGFKLPERALYREEYSGMSAEQIYERIRTEKIDDGVYIIKDIKDGDILDGVIIDEHKLWERAVEKLSEAEKKKIEEKWRERIVRAAEVAKLQGSLPAGLKRCVDELISPRLNWRDLLRMYISEKIHDDYTWMRPQKKLYTHGIYYPAIENGEGIEIAIGLDTSGSITGEELRDFISELQGIVSSFKRFRIHAFAVDAKIQTYKVIESLDDFNDFKVDIKGGGGTVFSEVFEKIEEEHLNIKIMVWMTDLFASGIPKDAPPYDIIWLVPREHGNPPPYGEMIEFE